MLRFLIFLVFIFILIYLFRKNQLISSVSIWLFGYFLIFVIFPTYSDDFFINKSMIDLIAFIGIMCFFVGVFLGPKIVYKKHEKKCDLKLKKPKFNTALIFYNIFFVISLLSIFYVFGISNTIGIIKGSIAVRSVILNSSNSIICTYSIQFLIPCLLSLWVTASNKKQKRIRFLCLLLYLVESFIFTFTRLYVISTILIIFFYEMKGKTRKKQIIYTIISIFSLLSLLVIMNFIRCLGFSYNVDVEVLFNIDTIFESTDFASSYETFDKLLNFNSPYINPIVYLKPLFAFIPRSIWPSKPESLNVQVLRYISSASANEAVCSGISVLGEGYAILGYFGSCFCCFLWGFLCSKLDCSYYNRIKNDNSTSLNDIMYYIFAVFIVISALRGDWSLYMLNVIFIFYVPLYLISTIKVRSKSNE